MLLRCQVSGVREKTRTLKLRSEKRETDGREIFGDTIVELTEDGTLTEIWNSFDDFDPENSMYINEEDNDWMHVNFIHYDRERDKYMIVLDRINAVGQVDRQTGTLVYKMHHLYPVRGAYSVDVN